MIPSETSLPSETTLVKSLAINYVKDSTRLTFTATSSVTLHYSRCLSLFAACLKFKIIMVQVNFR